MASATGRRQVSSNSGVDGDVTSLPSNVPRVGRSSSAKVAGAPSSPRLYRLGRHQPRVHPGEPERQHAVHPDVFVSMTGEALDHKTLLLRSQQALGTHAERILKLFGDDNLAKVVSFRT